MKPLFTFLMMLLLSGAAPAQLSGNYTIGGTSPDYPTVNDAATALQNDGISGPVVFDIRPGTYNGKVFLGTVTGTSATNTITFQSENGDNTSVIITDSSSAQTASNFTVLINGTDYLNFNQVTLERSGTLANSTVLFIGSGSHHVSFTDCAITAGNSTTTTSNKALVYVPLGSALDTALTFIGNTFTGGSYGLLFQGQGAGNPLSPPAITGNIFQSQYFAAIHCRFVASPVISSNTISTTSTNTTYTGISLVNGSGTLNVTSNIITGINSGGHCIFLDTCNASSGNEGLIANNFLHTQGTGTARGIRLRSSSFQDIVHNTIHITTSTAASAALYIAGPGSDVSVLNNILVNSGPGYAYYLEANGLTSIDASDYNDLYVMPGDTTLAYTGTADATNLNAWQTLTSLDQNSVSVDPQFTSPTDLHAGDPGVNDAGTPVASVTTDIDGEPRSGSSPDIGADEFTPLTDNVGLISIFSPATGACGDSATVVGVVIRNFGLDPQTGFPVTAELTGDITATLNENFTGSLNSNQADTLYFSQTVNTYQGGSVLLTVFTELGGDQYLLNDTLSVSLTFGGHPNSPTVVSPQDQCDNNVMITATPDSGDVLFWYDQPTGGTLLYTGSTFTPVVSNDTTFYVESREGSGSSGCLRMTEISVGTSDFIEIQNLSSGSIDATGWKVVVSDSYTDVNAVNANTWDLGVFTAGEIQYRTDATADNYWGSNMLFNPGNNGWAMIVNDQGDIVDFIAWEWDSLTLSTLSINVNGFPVSVGSEWLGNGTNSCTTTEAIVRTGNEDHNSMADFVCETGTKGTQNPNIASTFINCGTGACGSPRVAIDIVLISGVSVNLGNDTLVSSPFSITLDAGAGMTGYLWSTGDTTQTITVTTYGLYYVTVAGSNGCTFTDSILIDMPVSIRENFADVFSLYPVPATDKLMLEGSPAVLSQTVFTILDAEGRVAEGMNEFRTGGSIDVSTLQEGFYFLRADIDNRSFVTKFVIIR